VVVTPTVVDVHPEAFFGTDTFSTACPTDKEQQPATVTIVTAVDDAPSAQSLDGVVWPKTPPRSSTWPRSSGRRHARVGLDIAIQTSPRTALTENPDGTFTYTGEGLRPDSFTYVRERRHPDSNEATVEITSPR
jgi:hypothetical protein